jgi:hypothetical protein
VNYVDPDGLWSIGLGVVFGYTKSKGFHIGLGAAFDLGDNMPSTSLAYNWHQDGSNTFNASGYGRINLFGLNLYAGGGYAWDSRSGNTLSAYTGASLLDLAGVEAGGSLYFDRGWNYQGASAYGQLFAGYGPARVYAGYEQGFGNISGRGWYSGASAAGIGAEYSQNGGWGYGASVGVVSASYHSEYGLKGNYFGRGLINAFRNTKPTDEQQWEAYRGDKDMYFNTNHCGPGGAGGVTGAVDQACYDHDRRYDAAGAEGTNDALLNFQPTVLAADWLLARDAWKSFFTFKEPLAGFGVGAAFTLISSYKTLGMADYRYHKYQY